MEIFEEEDPVEREKIWNRVFSQLLHQRVIYRDESGKEHDITGLMEKSGFERVVRCKDCKWRKTKSCNCPGMPDLWYCGDGINVEEYGSANEMEELKTKRKEET